MKIVETTISEEDAEFKPVIGTPKKKPAEAQQPALPPKISALNESLRAIGRGLDCLEADASDEQITRAEKIVIRHSVSKAVPFNGGSPAEHQRKVNEYLVHVHGRSDSAPGFLRRLLGRAEKAKQEAAAAQRDADNAIEVAADRHARYEATKLAIENAVADLKAAQQRRDDMEEALAELDSPEGVTDRWISKPAPQDPDDFAKYVDWNRIVLRAVLSEWPVAEKILQDRIAKLEKALKAIENET